jgi:uncharacterized protein YbjT (DUF2867 family)
MNVFVTGGTGYLGRPLIAQLLERGYRVRALARPGSENRLPPGTEIVTGNALDAATWADHVAPADTLVHLVGTPRPSPSKAELFRQVDLASIRAAVAAATRANVRHFVYLSVAQPAPIMKAYIAVRQRGEALIRDARLDATILRPWYVLGPGHWWPYALVPVYWLLRVLPSTAESARRLGLVTHRQMLNALVHAVEHPPNGVRIVDVPKIRESMRGHEVRLSALGSRLWASDRPRRKSRA